MSRRKGNLRNEGEGTGWMIRRIREWKAGWQMFEFYAKREMQRRRSWTAEAPTRLCSKNEPVKEAKTGKVRVSQVKYGGILYAGC